MTIQWCEVHRCAYEPEHPNPAATSGVCLYESEFGMDNPDACHLESYLLVKQDEHDTGGLDVDTLVHEWMRDPDVQSMLRTTFGQKLYWIGHVDGESEAGAFG